jgi:hypothetical protein
MIKEWFCLKFISDPKNHLLVGNPTAGRLRRLIVVQIKNRLMQVQDRKDRQQITKKSGNISVKFLQS